MAGVDLLVEVAYRLIALRQCVAGAVEAFFLHQYPYTRELAVVANSLNGAVVVFAAANGEKPFWLSSLLTVAMTAYGGGIIAPIFIGRPSLPFGNDLVMLTVVLAWYVVHYTRLQPLLVSLPVRAVWSVFLGVFRLYSVTNMVTLAFNTLPTSPYYPHPFFGPILCGTIVGSMGMFLPFNKGLAPVSKQAPWNLQAALYSAFFFHTMVNDANGFVGRGMRLMLGTYSRETIIILIGLFQVVHLELQLFISPNVNVFAFLHKILYLVFQVQGPVAPPQTSAATAPAGTKIVAGWGPVPRRRMEQLFSLLQPLLVLAVFCGHCFHLVLPPSLPAHNTRYGNDSWSYSVMRYSTNLNTKWAHRRPDYQHQPGKQYFDLEVNRFEFEDLREESLVVGQGLGNCQYLNPLTSPASSPAPDGLLGKMRRACNPYVAVLVSYPCTHDPDQPGAAVQVDRNPALGDALRCRLAPALTPARPVQSPTPAPTADKLAASANRLKLFDWTKPTVNQPLLPVQAQAAAVDAQKHDQHLSSVLPGAAIPYAEVSLAVYRGLVVNKFDVASAVQRERPVRLYPLLQTNHTLFRRVEQGKPVHLLVLDDGHMVIWAHNLVANASASNRVITYTYVDRAALGVGLVSQGERVVGLALDEARGDIVMRSDGVQLPLLNREAESAAASESAGVDAGPAQGERAEL